MVPAEEVPSLQEDSNGIVAVLQANGREKLINGTLLRHSLFRNLGNFGTLFASRECAKRPNWLLLGAADSFWKETLTFI